MYMAVAIHKFSKSGLERKILMHSFSPGGKECVQCHKLYEFLQKKDQGDKKKR